MSIDVPATSTAFFVPAGTSATFKIREKLPSTELAEHCA